MVKLTIATEPRRNRPVDLAVIVVDEIERVAAESGRDPERIVADALLEWAVDARTVNIRAARQRTQTDTPRDGVDQPAAAGHPDASENERSPNPRSADQAGPAGAVATRTEAP